MSKKRALIEVLVIVVVFISAGLFLGYRIGWEKGYHKAWGDYELGFKDGKRSQHDYKPEYQTSEFKWGSFDLDPLIAILCEKAGIDSNDSFIIYCPKCDAAHVESNTEGSTWIGHFYIDADWTLDGVAADPNNEDYGKTIHRGSGVYCKFCMYPLGTDWKIIQLGD